jgi:hypothetical protein
MTTVLLLIVALALLFHAGRQLLRNFEEIRAKNQAEPWIVKRALNWPLGLVWTAYLLTFGIGLIANNLIWK